MTILLLIVGIILFIGLVVIHEFGHFIMARRGGVDVEEFGIFFPPRLYKHKTKGGWDFTINALPLGGFVKLKGEHDTDTAKGSFGAAPLWTKTKIMAAGVVMNLLIAFVLLTLLALIGMPKLVDNQFTVKSDTKVSKSVSLVGAVEKGSPAEKAGLKADDELLAIGPKGHLQALNANSTLRDFTNKYAGQTVTIEYKRGGGPVQQTTATLLSPSVVNASQKAYDTKVAAAKTDCTNIPLPKGYLGITPSSYTAQRSTWSAPVTAVGVAGQFTALTFEGLGHAIGGLGSTIAGGVTGNSAARQNGQCSASSQVSGPVGIFVVLKAGSSLGYQFMLMIIAIISLTLAIMNILPVPALDGGRLWITLIARAFKRPLSAHTEEVVNATGFLILIGIVILVTIVDIQRFF